MYKNYILFIFFLSTTMYSQNIEERLQSDICLCVERQMKRPWRQQNGSVLEICLLEKIKQYPAEFIETLKQEQFIEQKRVKI